MNSILESIKVMGNAVASLLDSTTQANASVMNAVDKIGDCPDAEYYLMLHNGFLWRLQAPHPNQK